MFWRLLILLVGSTLLWVSLFKIYPYAGTRLPIYVILLLFYSLFAYILIPALVRLFRLVIKPNHLPVYTTSRDGWSSDPINIVILCKNRSHLIKAMEHAGWHKADPVTPRTTLRLGVAMALRRAYPTAPFSNLYLFGRKQDIGFQLQTGNKPSPRHRHHVRFWRLTLAPGKQPTHTTFWQTILGFFRRKDRQIWIGAATHDIAPFAFRIQNLQLTHQIDADTNIERDFLIKSLESGKLVSRIEIVKTGEPLSFRGQTFGVRIIVDGLLKVIELRQP